MRPQSIQWGKKPVRKKNARLKHKARRQFQLLVSRIYIDPHKHELGGLLKRVAKPAILLALVGVTIYGGWHLSRSRSFQLFGDLYTRVQTTEKVVALTFDDGPTAQALQSLLPVLRERDVRATFFVIGAQLEQYPELGRTLVDQRHEIGNHSYSHARMVFKSPAFVREELSRTDALIRQAGYSGEIHFRPPNGKKLVVLPFLLSRERRATIMWDVEPDSDPGTARNAERIVSETISQVQPGSIILLHVMYKSGAPSLAAVPQIIDILKSRGYRFVTVSELIGPR
jgi:chitin deacetylase